MGDEHDDLTHLEYAMANVRPHEYVNVFGGTLRASAAPDLVRVLLAADTVLREGPPRPDHRTVGEVLGWIDAALRKAGAR